LEYIAVYKCQLCGTLLTYGDPKEIPYEVLPEICAKVIQNQQFAGNPYLYQAPMQIPHKCKDGNCGMAYFAGFMQKK
jgi:hypothetical protein